MAERQMFSKTIIDSDAFLDMPLSTQALYFHLSMRADDDGFVNSPKKISKMIGASDDELKVLFAKRFILGFESGIIVIKHWRIHNYIQKDRYRETSYVEEKAMLSHKENAGYTLDTSCIQNGDSGKDRLELGKSKDSLEIEIDEVKDILSASPLETTIIEESIKYLNAKTGAKYKATTPKTRTLIKARIKEGFSLNDFYTVIDKKVLMWSQDSKMQAYLRPETLFSPKFESYLNEIVTPSSALVASGAISSQDARSLETGKRWADKKMGRDKMTAQEFYKPFTLLCLAYNRELTDALAEVYYMVLENLTAQEFQSAIKEVLATRKYTNLPMPADILEAVHGNPDERAIIALKQAKNAVSRFGMYKSVIFQDKALQATIEGFFTNGWIDFCKQCGGDEWKFQKIEFVKLYKAYLKQDKKPKGDYLVGWCQHQNEISAIETEPENVYLVGYQQAPYCLPAPTVKELIRKQTPQIESKRDVAGLITVKKIGE